VRAGAGARCDAGDVDSCSAPAEMRRDRRRSCAAETRSTTCMVPPQRGQFRTEWGARPASWCLLQADQICWSNRKQSGRSSARRRLARKPKLRMRTKPRGSRCSRKRRTSASIQSSSIGSRRGCRGCGCDQNSGPFCARSCGSEHTCLGSRHLAVWNLGRGSGH